MLKVQGDKKLPSVVSGAFNLDGPKIYKQNTPKL